MKHKIGILGAGTWGMALARMLTVSGNDVTVWSALEQEIDNLSTTRVHPNLPGMTIPAEMKFTKSVEEVCTDKEILLFAVPSVFVRSTAAKARPFVPDGQIIVDVAKGIEKDTLFTMTEILADELGKEGGPKGVRLVALSGPTHAEEWCPEERDCPGRGHLHRPGLWRQRPCRPHHPRHCRACSVGRGHGLQCPHLCRSGRHR